jgi:hypothetical protein
MSEELKCGCGGGLSVLAYGDGHEFNCNKCGATIVVMNTSLQDAISAFRLATRADIKSGINWISVKDRLPEKPCWYLFINSTEPYEFKEAGVRILFWGDDQSPAARFDNRKGVKRFTHWAEINLPKEGEK